MNVDDAATCLSVSQEKAVLESSEHVACKVQIQGKFENTWWFDRGADAHVMPTARVGTVGRVNIATDKCHAERNKWTASWGHRRSACQRFRWTSESSIHSGVCTRRKTMPLERNTIQSEAVHVHVESERELSRTTQE